MGNYTYKSSSSGTPLVEYAQVNITKEDLDKGTDTTECVRNYGIMIY